MQRLVENEEELSKNKKLNIKEFLENFDRDKEKSEELVKKLTEEKRIRKNKNERIRNNSRKTKRK